jgi:hypothetical protein
MGAALMQRDVVVHLDRFMGFVEPQENGCWYRYSRARDNGYTTIMVSGRRVGAHRFAYAAFVGDIPEGMEIDHRCRDRGCVNPEHLELVSREENLRRRDAANPGEFAAADLRERIMSRVVASGECLLWTGALVRGYGVVSEAGRSKYVHRVMYELSAGPIADGLDLDHLCRTPTCVNPDHLEPVSRSENVARMLNAQPKDRCRRGHRYDEVGRTAKGACIACYEAANARRAPTSRPAPRPYKPRRGDRETHCAQGHEYEVTGRFRSGGCRQCQAEKDAARGQRADSRIERYCPNGHDLALVGQRAARHCQACWDEGWCANGHDMNVVGRTPGGRCAACRTDRSRTYAVNRSGVCSKGHDLAVVGVNPTNGQCRECARVYAREKHGYRYTADDLTRVCRNGHPRTPENTKVFTRKRGDKVTTETVCRDCARQRNRDYQQRKDSLE